MFATVCVAEPIIANWNMLVGSTLKVIVLVTNCDMTLLTCQRYTQGQLFLLAMHIWGR